MFTRLDENPAMTLQDIKETKRYGRTDAQSENSIPTTNKVCGGYNYSDWKLGVTIAAKNDICDSIDIVGSNIAIILLLWTTIFPVFSNAELIFK